MARPTAGYCFVTEVTEDQPEYNTKYKEKLDVVSEVTKDKLKDNTKSKEKLDVVSGVEVTKDKSKENTTSKEKLDVVSEVTKDKSKDNTKSKEKLANLPGVIEIQGDSAQIKAKFTNLPEVTGDKLDNTKSKAKLSPSSEVTGDKLDNTKSTAKLSTSSEVIGDDFKDNESVKELQNQIERYKSLADAAEQEWLQYVKKKVSKEAELLAIQKRNEIKKSVEVLLSQGSENSPSQPSVRDNEDSVKKSSVSSSTADPKLPEEETSESEEIDKNQSEDQPVSRSGRPIRRTRIGPVVEVKSLIAHHNK